MVLWYKLQLYYGVIYVAIIHEYKAKLKTSVNNYGNIAQMWYNWLIP